MTYFNNDLTTLLIEVKHNLEDSIKVLPDNLTYNLKNELIAINDILGLKDLKE